jgi:hypothetical protein
MRALLLLAALLSQQPDVTGQWVGPLEMTVQAPERARGAIPTDVEMHQDGNRITGTWRSRPPNTSSGTISGTLEKPEIVFYADSDTQGPERCQAVMHAKGRLTSANIYRIEAKDMTPDTRPKKGCGNWPTDVVWLLQRAH